MQGWESFGEITLGVKIFIGHHEKAIPKDVAHYKRHYKSLGAQEPNLDHPKMPLAPFLPHKDFIPRPERQK